MRTKEIIFDKPIKVLNVDGKDVYFKGFYQYPPKVGRRKYEKLLYNGEFLNIVTVSVKLENAMIDDWKEYNFPIFVKNGKDAEEIKNEIIDILKHYVHYYVEDTSVLAYFYETVTPKYQAFINALMSGEWFKYNKRRA